MKNFEEDKVMVKQSEPTNMEMVKSINVSLYVEIIQDYIQKKNNVLTTATYGNGTKRPELVLASRSSENPICVIDRTTDSIYRIKIETINKINTNMVIGSNTNQSAKDEIYLSITLNDTNDILQVEHNIRYRIDDTNDKLFKQLLPGIFVNSIY